MHKMLAPLFLLALLIIPSALQKQTELVDQKLVDLPEWLGPWKPNYFPLIMDNQVDLENALKKLWPKV